VLAHVKDALRAPLARCFAASKVAVVPRGRSHP